MIIIGWLLVSFSEQQISLISSILISSSAAPRQSSITLEENFWLLKVQILVLIAEKIGLQKLMSHVYNIEDSKELTLMISETA
jgi:hypothetical protein